MNLVDGLIWGLALMVSGATALTGFAIYIASRSPQSLRGLAANSGMSPDTSTGSLLQELAQLRILSRQIEALAVRIDRRIADERE